MAYVIFTSDPGSAPGWATKLSCERDGADGSAEAVYAVQCDDASDSDLMVWAQGTSIAIEAHGAGGPVPSDWCTRTMSGLALAQMRSLMDALMIALDATAPAIRPGLKSQLSAVAALLPVAPQ